MEAKERSSDKAAQEMIEQMAKAGQQNAWDRFEAQSPQCGFGKQGICCRNCAMGPCRIDPFGDGAQAGVCGATADTIAARNLIRMIAGGAAFDWGDNDCQQRVPRDDSGGNEVLNPGWDGPRRPADAGFHRTFEALHLLTKVHRCRR